MIQDVKKMIEMVLQALEAFLSSAVFTVSEI